jgi:hypothetical protein
MAELLASMMEAVGLALQSPAGDVGQLFEQKAQGTGQTEKGVTR